MKRAVINRKQNAEVLTSHGKDRLDSAAVSIFVVILVEEQILYLSIQPT